MKTAQDYPVTTPWGYSADYPLNEGRHKGEDRAMPTGTPVVVNGELIGLSGNTGYSTGPHLHIGRWLKGVDTNPNGGGLTLPGPVTITQVSTTEMEGNYVALNDVRGVRWVYLHLSKQTVKPGQIIKSQGGTAVTPQQQKDLVLGEKARKDGYQSRLKADQVATLELVKNHLSDDSFMYELKKLVQGK